jgi:hypothetical protein
MNMEVASGLIIVVDARIVDRLGFHPLDQQVKVCSEVDGSRQNLKAR